MTAASLNQNGCAREAGLEGLLLQMEGKRETARGSSPVLMELHLDHGAQVRVKVGRRQLIT